MWHLSFVRCIIPCTALAVALLRHDAKDEYTAHLIVAGIAIIFTGTAFIEYQTYIKPTKRLAQVRSALLTNFSKDFRTQVTARAVPIRLNVQEIFRPMKYAFILRYFRIIWGEGMQNHPDVGMKLPIASGVVGACLTEKRPIFADRAKLQELQAGLPRKYRNGVSDLTAVLCFPIYEPPNQGVQTGKILGVLCLDSKAPGAFEKLTETTLFDEVVGTKMEEMALVTGWLL